MDKRLDPKKLTELTNRSAAIRNICIMAHVDHGKTTLADLLIAANGIISQRLAGKLRYLDSRRDEQERGITMKSSAITLYHTVKQNSSQPQEYLVNLIDSPGHVDFAAEVSTAVRLCDGALILVDVVEGVCPQTRVALEQAWLEKIKPLLVLNKVDRLVLETKLSAADAYLHLTQIVEQVNSIMGELFRNEVLESAEQRTDDWSSGLEEADDSHVYFAPEQGNVIFASAVDGWAFTIRDFARKLAIKMSIDEETLVNSLWGDYYVKGKHVIKGAQENGRRPLFVQYVLETLWLVYETAMVEKDREKMGSLAAKVGIDLPAQSVRYVEPRVLLRVVLGKWLPMAACILDAICALLPAPNQLTGEKVDCLLRRYGGEYSDDLKIHFTQCEAENAPVIVFVSKMFPVERRHLPKNRVRVMTMEEIQQRRVNRAKTETDRLMGKKEESETKVSSEAEDKQTEDEKQIAPPVHATESSKTDEVFIAFSRIYSGRIRVNQELYVLGPKHDPKKLFSKMQEGYEVPWKQLKDLTTDEHVTRTKIKSLYFLMGRELESVEEISAGNVFGIGGLEEHILKTATLSTELSCPPFTELRLMAAPILRVAIEPENPAHLPQLVAGLKLLNQADPSVQVLIQETGEHVLITAGEVHLQRCVEDLKERYAKIPVLVSEPIVPFRETIVQPPSMDMVNEEIKGQNTYKPSENEIITVHTANNTYSITIKAISLPKKVVEVLEKHVDFIKYLATTDHGEETVSKFANVSKETNVSINEFKSKLDAALKEISIPVKDVWSFGPKNCGSNLLFNLVEDSDAKMTFWRNQNKLGNNVYTKYESSVLQGFQMATFAGPLCEEPMMGVGFIIYDWKISEEIYNSASGSISGQLISAAKDGCRKAFQLQPQRLMAAMYTCNILVNTEVLGKMYGLLNKRHGRITYGDLAASSSAMFNVTAYLPVAESFLFASEVRKQTSGLANPQLVFSHWEVIDLDPFWKPNTEEEYLLYGEKADSENYARTYMNNVRRRKGLAVDEMIIEHGEKQRTLSKKK